MKLLNSYRKRLLLETSWETCLLQQEKELCAVLEGDCVLMCESLLPPLLSTLFPEALC